MQTKASIPIPSTAQPVWVEPTLPVGGSSSMKEGQTSTRPYQALETPRKTVSQDSSILRAMTPTHSRLLLRCPPPTAPVMERSLSIHKVEYSSIGKRAVTLTHPDWRIPALTYLVTPFSHPLPRLALD